jgi:hypothetical protein
VLAGALDEVLSYRRGQRQRLGGDRSGVDDVLRDCVQLIGNCNTETGTCTYVHQMVTVVVTEVDIVRVVVDDVLLQFPFGDFFYRNVELDGQQQVEVLLDVGLETPRHDTKRK